ncbi:MAG: hypothetical protein COB26_01385 [Piscirickettsiaceae bacterium]|nr:MAG: hypothetical protein COB26_08175 [Piscirickettsiaceae bacterium]PCI71195.1 MAG: hypothetical protein COB26_01385 [Piscirickettsiaceae bacterium]
MDVYQTEEEQVESLKKWWAENSRSIIFGVGIGLFAIFGWQSWKEHAHTQAVESSGLYEQMVKAVKNDNPEAAIQLSHEINKTYGDTPYVGLAGLQKAKIELEQSKRKEAIATLMGVADSANNNSIQHIARLRAFRLRVGDADMTAVINDIDDVIAEKNGINPGEFIGQYEAVKGDAYRLLGDVKNARYSYIAALRNATLDKRLMQLKLDDLGPPPKSEQQNTGALTPKETAK